MLRTATFSVSCRRPNRPIHAQIVRRYKVTRPKRTLRRDGNETAVQPASPPVESSLEPSLLRQPLAWYSRKLDTHPLWTKCISSGLVAGSGDLLSQYIRHVRQERNDKFHWDIVRTGRFATLGFALVAPVVHLWYGALMTRFPGTSAVAVAKRVALDQAFFSPLFLPTWLVNLWILEGKDFNYIMKELREQVPKSLVANWVLWTPAQVINFRFVPGKYQVLFSNFVGFVWNAYLSYTTHQHGGDLV